MVTDPVRRPAAPVISNLTLGFDPVVVGLESTDTTAVEWLREFLEPWFTPETGEPDWRIRLSTCPDRYAGLGRDRPLDASSRACFVFDQQMLSLPEWKGNDRIVLADAERSLFLTVAPFEVDLNVDVSTRRWRFPLVWILTEVVSTRLRRTHLDLHAAAVETRGRSLLIAGPKQAGKTTLSFHLLRSGGCRWIANDRVFAEPTAGSFRIRGMPSAVKIRPATVAGFPELCAGPSLVERPYLLTLDELARAEPEDQARQWDELALTPAQLASRLGAQRLATAPLGAILFPQIRPGLEGWALEALDAGEVCSTIAANLYGGARDRRAETLFEELDGGARFPSPVEIEAFARAVPGYRVLLGEDAYVRPDFAARLLERVAPW